MKFRNMALKYYFQNEAEAEQGAGGGEPEKTFTQADVQKMIDEQVNGLKNKNSELLGTLKKQKEQLSQFDGIDPDAVRNILKRFSDDEESKLIAEGKIDEVLSKRTERMTGDYEKKLKSEQEKAESYLKRAQAYESKVFENAIRQEAAKAGLHQFAVDDAILRAKNMFHLGENGDLQALDADGQLIYGKDGKSGLTVSEWFESQKETAPHWFPSIGGSGTKGGHGTSRVPSSLAECKTEAEEIEYLKHTKKE